MKRLMYRYLPNVGGRPPIDKLSQGAHPTPTKQVNHNSKSCLENNLSVPLVQHFSSWGSFTCLAFHGMDFINTDRPEMVFVSIPLSVQESVAVLRETTELHEKRLSSLCEF
ncbi:unnamed protein product [Prunus armeniaca]|uniref:Uncharacterized protein n=1 Tax=Prunus armeniaca TaxID=36596 RepID=A0A6J5VUB7_PRUAR|nr:unnamed protein product [Prunus armeniaca]